MDNNVLNEYGYLEEKTLRVISDTTSIPNGAYQDKKGIECVVIAENIRYIASKAFLIAQI